jgi:nucleoside-diphosphate-sugar epimerase
MVHQSVSGKLTTCVIGGAGFIGRAVVDALLIKKRRVVVVGRNDSPTNLPDGVVYLENAPAQGHEVIRQVIEQADEVVDLAYATSPGTSFQDPVNDILVNVPETVRLFEMAASMSHLRKFVWISSGGTVYGGPLPNQLLKPIQPTLCRLTALPNWLWRNTPTCISKPATYLLCVCGRLMHTERDSALTEDKGL